MTSRRKRKNRTTIEDRELFTGIAFFTFLAAGFFVLIMSGIIR